MKFTTKKGYPFTQEDLLTLGRLLLKMGYTPRLQREKIGSTVQWSIELYEEVPFGQKESRP